MAKWVNEKDVDRIRQKAIDEYETLKKKPQRTKRRLENKMKQHRKAMANQDVTKDKLIHGHPKAGDNDAN